MTESDERWDLPTRRLGRPVLRYSCLASTNDTARELAVSESGEGLAVLADTQTAGRGQHGRTWTASAGSSVLLSVVLTPTPALCRPAILTAWAAVAVSETVSALTESQGRVKWPNDVLLSGRKVCGILIEQAGPGVFVVGVGLNVMQSLPDFEAAGLPNATSLWAESGRELSTVDVARRLLWEMDRSYDELLSAGSATLEARWRERVGLLGRSVCVEGIDGSVRRGRLIEQGFDGLTLTQTDGVCWTVPPEGVRHLSAEPG